jgi:hypothetical protein
MIGKCITVTKRCGSHDALRGECRGTHFPKVLGALSSVALRRQANCLMLKGEANFYG